MFPLQLRRDWASPLMMVTHCGRAGCLSSRFKVQIWMARLINDGFTNSWCLSPSLIYPLQLEWKHYHFGVNTSPILDHFMVDKRATNMLNEIHNLHQANAQ
jgi:hypothetical protein